MAILGRKHTNETKKKLRLARLGRKLTDETKAKLRAAQLGRKHTEETKAKIKAGNLGKTGKSGPNENMSASKKAALDKLYPVILRAGTSRVCMIKWLRKGATEEEIGLHLDALEKGVCEFCGEPEKVQGSSNKTTRSLAYDHDPTTPAKYRATLCQRHNRALGVLGDSPSELRRMADLLERYT